MANKISDTESIISSTSSSAGSATTRFKSPSEAKSKVWKYFGFSTNESGVIVYTDIITISFTFLYLLGKAIHEKCVRDAG